MSAVQLERVRAILGAAARLADANDELGRSARELLPNSTGLSRQGVELALTTCLERDVDDAQLARFCAGVTPCRRAHVILPSNVFTAPVRAIALAAAASSSVWVRASTREPVLPQLLLRATSDSYTIVRDLEPARGDHVWAYGSDETMAALKRSAIDGVVLHAHGAGFGVALMGPGDDAPGLAEAITTDTILFDQRGCLSPRLVLFEGSAHGAHEFARVLAQHLADAESRVPVGQIHGYERAECQRFQATLRYAGEVFSGGSGSVAVSEAEHGLLLPPPGRHLHVVACRSATAVLERIAAGVTVVGTSNPSWNDRVRTICGNARLAPLGEMQRPAFDGPVDLRTPRAGQLIERSR
jgi:hypothetical protein